MQMPDFSVGTRHFSKHFSTILMAGLGRDGRHGKAGSGDGSVILQFQVHATKHGYNDAQNARSDALTTFFLSDMIR